MKIKNFIISVLIVLVVVSCTIWDVVSVICYDDGNMKITRIECNDITVSPEDDDYIYHYKVTLQSGNTEIILYTNSRDYSIGDRITFTKVR